LRTGINRGQLQATPMNFAMESFASPNAACPSA
jgi:hypothetical protein